MPITADTKQAPLVVRFTWTGPWPTRAEQDAATAPLVESNALTAHTRVLIDIRGLTTLPFLVDVRATIDSARATGKLPAAIAVLAGTQAQFGIARMFQALIPDTVRLEVFTDELRAVEWIETRPRVAC